VTDSPPALPLQGIVNLRDVGGQLTRDERRVRTGVLFRSGQLDQDHTTSALSGLDLSVVFDLRGADEVAVAPDLVPTGVEVVHLDVLAGSRERIATHLNDLLTQPTLVEESLRSGAVEEHYRATYRNLVLLDSARTAYSELFGRLAGLERPALFHCTAGKDRTGWAAAALLTLLGVDDDAVTEDYLRSSQPVLESFRTVFERFAEVGGDPSVLVPVFAVTEDYLQAARDAVAEQFGDVEGWFRDGLGLPPEVPDLLRDRLLV
jgi:protein-tyrosine phosphatase